MKIHFVIFSGYNIRALIAFLRTLKIYNVGFSIIACTDEDFIFQTIYSENVVFIREGKELILGEIVQILKQIKEKNDGIDEFFILPSSEFLNRFLLSNRKHLENMGFRIPLVEEKLYWLISDKSSFTELCSRNGIKIPEETKEIPMVAKPKKYFSSDKKPIAPYIILSEDDYKKFREKENEQDFFFQRYIQGESIYLLNYFYKDGKVDSYSQRNLMQQSGGKSIIAAEYSDFWKSEEANKYIELLKNIGYYGLIMIEIRRENDNYYMIEANPRIWGPSQFLLDSKANLLESMLYELGAIESRPCISKSFCKEAKYFWKEGIDESVVLHCDEHELKVKWNELEKYNIFRHPDIKKN